MTSLQDIFAPHVRDGSLPGAVALVARGDRVEVATAGSAALGGGSPMARDSIFRIASITKPITAAAVMMLVDERRIALDDPVDRWLPEIAKPVVVRTPDAPVDDVVPAARPITVADLLTFRAGWGFPSDFSLPAVQSLLGLQKHGLSPSSSRRPTSGWRISPVSRCSTSRVRHGCTTRVPTSRGC